MKYLASHSILTFLSALLAVTMPFLCHAEPESKVRLKTVVLDPGHGGHDAGCVSKDGKTYEKNLTLSIARQVGNKIKAAYPDVKVIYTRTTDKFIPLNERAEIANRNKADLFISIHINAVDSSSPTGTSAHVLGPSSNKNRDTFSESMELCRRENSVILLEDDYSTAYQGFNPNDPESYIIFNLLQIVDPTQSLIPLRRQEIQRQDAGYGALAHSRLPGDHHGVVIFQHGSGFVVYSGLHKGLAGLDCLSLFPGIPAA